MKKESSNPDIGQDSYNRRKFLSALGIGAAGTLVVAASCNKDSNDYPMAPPLPPAAGGNTIDFSSDIGVLNYAYALEQLEAAFYMEVAKKPASGFTPAQVAYFKDVQFHEIAHREFFAQALGSKRIGNLEVDFSAIDFNDAAKVLEVAQTFEDLGVAAYNGAGVLIKDPNYLLLAGKIVSVEARHAAWVRDQRSNGTFADLASLSAFGSDNANGLDGALTPDKVLPLAQPFIKTKINVVGL